MCYFVFRLIKIKFNKISYVTTWNTFVMLHDDKHFFAIYLITGKCGTMNKATHINRSSHCIVMLVNIQTLFTYMRDPFVYYDTYMQ